MATTLVARAMYRHLAAAFLRVTVAAFLKVLYRHGSLKENHRTL